MDSSIVANWCVVQIGAPEWNEQRRLVSLVSKLVRHMNRRTTMERMIRTDRKMQPLVGKLGEAQWKYFNVRKFKKLFNKKLFFNPKNNLIKN